MYAEQCVQQESFLGTSERKRYLFNLQKSMALNDITNGLCYNMMVFSKIMF